MDRRASQGGRLIILGAFGIVVAMFVCGVVLFLVFQASHSPADDLPANRTLAYFHNIARADRSRILNAFPTLSDFPPLPEDGVRDVALVSFDEGEHGWATFERHEKPTGILHTFAGEQFTVTSSSPKVEQLLQEKAKPLSAESTFTTLTHDMSESTWAFLQTDVITASLSDEERALLSALTSTPSLVVAWSADTVSVSMIRPSNAPARQILPRLSLSPAAQLSVSLAQPGTFYDTVANAMTGERSMVFEGLSRAWWRKIAGIDTFLDFPSLLAHPLTYTERSGSGSIQRFLIETTSGTDTPALLERLHTAARSLLQPFKVTKRDLTLGFTSTVIEEDSSLIADTTEQRNGWTVRQTAQQGHSPILLSATSDNRVLVSNDEDWMKQATKPSPSTAPALAGGETAVSACEGSLRTQRLFEWLETSGCPLAARLLKALGPESAMISFSASQRRNALTLTIGKIAAE